jgi:hypothetical protein
MLKDKTLLQICKKGGDSHFWILVGVKDNFFEVGGSEIIGWQLNQVPGDIWSPINLKNPIPTFV